MKILISGAGIAGPAAAEWLMRLGHEVTVVERAPALREGGQAVDFRGEIHRAVLEQMGIWDAIHERRTEGHALHFVDHRGHEIACLPKVMMSGDVEIQRGDLSKLLYERTRSRVEYRFGTWVTSIEPDADCVHVKLEGGGREHFDMLIGADGLHSGVRAQVFGDESQLVKHHGYTLATYSAPNTLGFREGARMFSEPGRAVMVSPERQPERLRALFVFRDDGSEVGRLRTREEQISKLRERYAGAGGFTLQLLEQLESPGPADLYVDAIASVFVPRYWQGRTVLLGDAAYGGTLGGQGTSLAIVGAYVLAGELSLTPNAPLEAFKRYEQRLRRYATGCQKGAARVGGFFAPRTRWGLALRNFGYRTLTSRLLIRQFERMVKASASDFVLPSYPALSPARARALLGEGLVSL